MTQTRKDLLEEQRRLKAQYAGLFEQLQALLFRHDPMAINYDFNTDEYDPEVGTILPRLSACTSPQDVTRVVHQEFVHWFGAEEVGNLETFSTLGAEIWQLWQTFKKAGPGTPTNDGPAGPFNES